MKFNKFIKLLKCGKIGKQDADLYKYPRQVRVVYYNNRKGRRPSLEARIDDEHNWCTFGTLELHEIESDGWYVEDETLTFKQILELSEKIGEVIVKRLEWKDLDRKKVLIISASEDGKLIQEKSHPDGYVDTVISMSRGDEEATDWIIVDE